MVKHPTFAILLSTDSVDSRVSINGMDITSSIRSITVHQIAGELPIVTLELTKGSHGASVRAQCEAILKLQDTIEACDVP